MITLSTSYPRSTMHANILTIHVGSDMRSLLPAPGGRRPVLLSSEEETQSLRLSSQCSSIRQRRGFQVPIHKLVAAPHS